MNKEFLIPATFWWLLCCFVYSVHSRNACQFKFTCGECIQVPECGWCSKPPTKYDDYFRCVWANDETGDLTNCPAEYLYFLTNSTVIDRSYNTGFSENDYASGVHGSSSKDPKKNHLSLKEVVLNLRLNQPTQFTLQYKHVENAYHPEPGWVELKSNTTEDISIKYYTNCGVAAEPEVLTKKCGNLEVDAVVDFTVEIELLKCSEDITKTIAIYALGLPEQLIVELSLECHCPCELPELIEVDSPQCHGFGNLTCGVCECIDGYIGRLCECAHGIC